MRFDDVIDIIPPCSMWSEEDYRDARKSQWQQHYLDRIRFKDRIEAFSKVFIPRNLKDSVMCRNTDASRSEATAA